MGVGSATGPGGQPVDSGSPPPGGPTGTGEGGTKPGEGAPPAGDDFGTNDGVVDQGEFLNILAQEGTHGPNDIAAQSLLTEIRLNTASAQGSTGAGASQGMMEGASDHAEAMADTHTDRFMDARELEARGEVRSDIRTALASGDRDAVMSMFSRFSASPGASGNPANKGAPNPNAANPNPNPGAAGPPVPNLPGSPGGRAAAAPPPAPPIFPNTTDPRLANLNTRTPTFVPPIAKQVPGEPPSPEQQLESQLRAALSASPPDEASARTALEGLAAMGIEMGETGEPDALADRAEVEEAAEGDGADGAGGGGSGSGVSRDGAAPRPVARTMTGDDLSRSVHVFARGEGGTGGDGAESCMVAGLRVVCGGRATGFATRVATDGAVRGTYAEGDESGGDGGGTGGGSSGDGSVAFGGLVDGDGSLAAGGYRLDTAAAGLGGSYGIRTADGKFIPQWLAMSDRGGLPPGVRAAVARDAGLRTRFGAEAVSGHRAGITGDLYAGAKC